MLALFPSGPGTAAINGGEPPAPPDCTLQDFVGVRGAQLQRRFYAEPPFSTNAVAAGEVMAGHQSWGAEWGNSSATALANPTISFTSGMDPALFVYGNGAPVTAFPVSCTKPSLGPNQQMAADDRLHRRGGWNGTVGYDSSRTVEPLELPAEGGEQTVTVSLTLRDARYSPWSWVSIFIDKAPDDTVVTLVAPTNLDQGEWLAPHSPGHPGWTLVEGRLDKTYVFTAVIDRANRAGTTGAYVPGVQIYAFEQQVQCDNCAFGHSATIPIPELDGDAPGSGAIVFSVDDPTPVWEVSYKSAHVVRYAQHHDFPPLPFIHASLTNDWVILQQWPANSQVTLTFNGGSPYTATVDGNGHLFIDRHLHGQDLVVGMVIVATGQGGTTKELLLPSVTFDSLDPVTDAAAGTAPAGEPVNVSLHREGHLGQIDTTADASGNWAVDFTGIVDVDWGMGGNAFVRDADGDFTSGEIHLRLPNIHASHSNDWIHLNDWKPFSQISLTIGGGAPYTLTTDEWGHAFLDRNARSEADRDLQIGTLIEASGFARSGNAVTKTLQLAAVTFDSLDPVTDEAAGTAPAGEPVNVSLHREGHLGQIDTTADASGNWAVDFTGIVDVDWGMGGNAFVRDADGDFTSGEIHLPRPAFHASLTNDWISGWGWPVGGPIDVIIDGVHKTTVIADADGHFFITPSVHSVDLVPGTMIKLKGWLASGVPSTTKETTLLDVTFDRLDPATDIASGRAPAGSELKLELYGGKGPPLATVFLMADTDGNWRFDFNGLVDVTFGMGGAANVSDEDGDGTTAEIFLRLPNINASLTFDWINLHAWPANSQVTLTFDGGSPYTATVDPNGDAFIDRSQHGLDLIAGMTIVATGPDGTPVKELVLAALTFDSLDPNTDRGSGTAPPGVLVRVILIDESTNKVVSQTETTADSGGSWSVTFAYDVTFGMRANARVDDGDGDNTFAAIRLLVPDRPTSIGDCQSDGWRTFGFRNQGECVSSVAKDARGRPAR